MRLVIRLVVFLGLVLGLSLSSTALSPVALADDTPSPTAPTVGSGASSGASAPGETGSEPSVDGSEAVPPLETTITAQPLSTTTSSAASFAYRANRPGVSFRCSLTGRDHSSTTMVPCPADPVAGSTTTGKTSYSGLKASRTAYRFSVQAYVPSVAGTPEEVGTVATYAWRRFYVTSVRAYSPRTGASFNRPLSTSSSTRRVNLTRIIRTVDAMPGYKDATGLCPTDPALVPGQIRVSLYSLTDMRVANALVAAHARCLSVQVLMNNHLNRKTDPAWRRLEDALGTSAAAARLSFAKRCYYGCRGGGVLHTKMYLFNSTMPDQSYNAIRQTLFFGSSNMTSNAAKIQYNDLYGIRNDTSGLYQQFARMFDLMRTARTFTRNPTLPAAGPYRATFWPQPSGSTDTYTAALRSVACTGATGGTGIGGRTVVYINMHAWFGTRGAALASQVRALYNRGCYVRVLYSFMSWSVFKKLKRGTGSRMSVRRTLFSHNGKVAYVYTHFKNIAISGHVGSDTSAKVVYTGSNNFTDEGRNFDEVSVRMASASAYASYVRQFGYMRNRLSSATYANFSEPTGGGRAPRRTALVGAPDDTSTTQGRKSRATTTPSGTPTIQSPEVIVRDGSQTVRD